MKTPFKKLIVIMIIILTVGLVSGTFAAQRFLGSISKIDNETLITTSPDMEDFETDPSVKYEPTDEDLKSQTVTPIEEEQLINILLVGQDRLNGQKRQRSDTMILCSYNSYLNEVSLISFLRDLYVTIPGGYSKNRLNAPYVFGGFPLLYSTFKENFGISVDGGVEVDFNGFQKLIDLVGGVEITLTAAEAEHVPDSKAGINLLNGEMALSYARIRKTDSDFGRTNRQRTLLLKLFEKLRTKDAKTLTALLETALSMVTTDMSVPEIMGLASSLIPKLSSLKINTYAVPFEGSYKSAYINRMAVLVPNCEKIRDKLFNEYLPLKRN